MKTSILHFNPFTGLPCQHRFHGTASICAAVLATLLVAATFAFGATATFIQRDTTTQGTWIRIPTGAKIYGSEGYHMLGDDRVAISALPSYVSRLEYPGFHPYIWRHPNTAMAPRDLQLPVAPYTSRIASGWYFWPDYGDTNNTIELILADSAPHLMAMYFEDADSVVRREAIQILDAATDTLLDTRALDTPFDQGVWLLWKITGSVKIKVILTGPDNTVHSSTDLLAWPAAAATQSVTGTVDGVETVDVTLTDPPPVGGKRFVRVQAQ